MPLLTVMVVITCSHIMSVLQRPTDGPSVLTSQGGRKPWGHAGVKL